jgi:DNA-binding response OmpR family regulator
VVVQRGRVLVIEGDEWVGALLSRLLRDRGYAVDVCADARSGFETACRTVPDCIVCAVNLPDIDGFWVARRIRTESSAVSTAPILFLTDEAHPEARLQGLHVGADVYLSKPFSNDEVVAQVDALIDLARRLSVRRDSFAEAPGSGGGGAPVAIRGDIQQFALSTVLMMLEMERRSGKLKVATHQERASFELSHGVFVHAELGGRRAPTLDVLRTVLAWSEGRFWFRPKKGDAPTGARGESIGALVLEAMRLEDEEKEKRR